METIGHHNGFYLNEDRRLQPKEYFKLLVGLASEHLNVPEVRILDIGCATGDFLYYLASLFSRASLSGVDVNPEFVRRAKEVVPSADLFLGDIQAGFAIDDRYDVVFMSSVHYLFSDFEPWLRNLIHATRRAAYVFGIFNPEDLDVRAVVQRPGDTTSSTQWNLISQKSISGFLDKLRISHRFINWQLPIEIPRCKQDPIRSWTIETREGEYLTVNGTQILHRFAVLEITLGS